MATEAIQMGDVLEELKALRKDISFIKKHMFDPDCVLTADDKMCVAEAREDYRKGETIPIEELEKEGEL